MQTKFTQILKVKNSALERAGFELERAKALYQSKQDEIDEAMLTVEISPAQTSGSLARFRRDSLLRQTFFGDVARKEQELAALYSDLNVKRALYQEASLEYEKFKYLDDQEKMRLQKAMDLKEAKFLDELAGRAFAAGRLKV
ncbi:MAG: flagellar export protein FliJ [Helicobacteraceae bacterium]